MFLVCLTEFRTDYSDLIGKEPVFTWSYLSKFAINFTVFAHLGVIHDTFSDYVFHSPTVKNRFDELNT